MNTQCNRRKKIIYKMKRKFQTTRFKIFFQISMYLQQQKKLKRRRRKEEYLILKIKNDSGGKIGGEKRCNRKIITRSWRQ